MLGLFHLQKEYTFFNKFWANFLPHFKCLFYEPLFGYRSWYLIMLSQKSKQINILKYLLIFELLHC